MFTRFVLYPLLVSISLFVTFFSLLFVNWWAPALAQLNTVCDRGVCYEGYTLPKWLAWFDTFDADLDIAVPDGVEPTFWSRVQWLYRNHAYGFDYWVLGRVFVPSQWTVVKYLPPSDTQKYPYFYAKGPHGIFNLRCAYFGLQFKIGWKSWNYFQQDTMTWNEKPWGPEMRTPFTFSVSLAK